MRYAQSLITEAFGDLDPQHAQEVLPVDDFVKIVGPLKSKFTNSAVTKELVARYLESMGVELENTYFDVPRLRVVPHSNYLTAGVSYAYKAHRDIWYSSPSAQINWWSPVWEVTPDMSMAFYPEHFQQPIQNTSEEFDYDEWVRVGRAAATTQITIDTRKHPLPAQDIVAQELRYGSAQGDVLIFSASHLHATVPNSSDRTRFSVDFRTINLEDLRNSRGAPNVDSRSRGTTLGDFLSVSGFAPLEADLAA